MKWNSNPNRLSGDSAEWSASVPDTTEENPSLPMATRRDGYYHVISANHESRTVTVRTLDGALHFLEAMKWQQR